MAVSYKKLWKLLIDKDMIKKDLRELTGVTRRLDVGFPADSVSERRRCCV